MEELKENMRTILGDTSPLSCGKLSEDDKNHLLCGVVFYIGTSRDCCMQKMPKQPLVGPNVETVLEVQVIALEVSLDVQDMQEVSRHPMVEQEIPKQPVAWLWGRLLTHCLSVLHAKTGQVDIG